MRVTGNEIGTKQIYNSKQKTVYFLPENRPRMHLDIQDISRLEKGTKTLRCTATTAELLDGFNTKYKPLLKFKLLFWPQ